jgi:hypothetical protein
MADISTRAWRNIAIVAAVVLVLGLIVSGQFLLGIALLIILLALGGGALLSSKAGPPRR